MTIVVLLILAVIWAVVLIPPALRARSDARPADSIGAFRRQLSTLQRTGPYSVAPVQPLAAPSARVAPAARPVVRPATSTSASAARLRTQKRRRDVFLGLLAAMGLSLVLGFIPGLRILWLAHLLFDVLFAVYVGLLIRMRNVAAEREMKVRFLPGTNYEPALLSLRRSAN